MHRQESAKSKDEQVFQTDTLVQAIILYTDLLEADNFFDLAIE